MVPYIFDRKLAFTVFATLINATSSAICVRTYLLSLSVGGVLRSFRLMISSLICLILCSRAHFSISSFLLMNISLLPCRSFISCIIPVDKKDDFLWY